jgi:hypothetical protein
MFWIAVLIASVVVFINFPRATGRVFIIVGVLFLAVVLYVYLKLHQDDLDKSEVALTVKFDRSACPQEHPLRVKIANGSSKTIEKVEFQFDARRHGFSDNFAHAFPGARTDKILSPSESYESCWETPVLETTIDPSGLEWGISHSRVYFKR